MSQEIYTVEDAARQLKLHPKTVLRAIREGRLSATKVGKSYRIPRGSLEAFAGLPKPSETAAAEPWVTAIVDIPGVGSELAQKWARTVPGALNARRSGGPPLRADVIYEPERRHLKVIVVGPPGDVARAMTLVDLLIEQLTP